MSGFRKKFSLDKKFFTINGIKCFEVFIGIVLLGMGSTLGIIAGIGQTTAVSSSSAISEAFHIKVGTAMYIEYIIFFILQWIILGKNFKLIFLLQLIPSLVKTSVLNFFKYDFFLFQMINPHNYGERLILFLIGMIFNSLGFTATKCADYVNYPPESFCTAVANKAKLRFGTVKMGLDFVYIAITVVVCYFSGIGFGIVREGTLLFALVNGNLINLFTPYVNKIYKKLEDFLQLHILRIDIT